MGKPATNVAHLGSINDKIEVAKGHLCRIVVGTATATAVITVRSGGTVAAGTVIGIINGAVDPQTYEWDLWCGNGFSVEMTIAAAKVSVLYA